MNIFKHEEGAMLSLPLKASIPFINSFIVKTTRHGDQILHIIKTIFFFSKYFSSSPCALHFYIRFLCHFFHLYINKPFKVNPNEFLFGILQCPFIMVALVITKVLSMWRLRRMVKMLRKCDDPCKIYLTIML